jgi:2-polyprenyl-6-methoxyphenol hydroxylase-like FAD-dependent oxidoreductase
VTGSGQSSAEPASQPPVDNLAVGIRSVLVVGAGVAGSTLAYWLARHGMETTVVERAAAQRSSGNPVDVRGPALAVVERMNLLAPLREAATLATNLTLVDNQVAASDGFPHNPASGLRSRAAISPRFWPAPHVTTPNSSTTTPWWPCTTTATTSM